MIPNVVLLFTLVLARVTTFVTVLPLFGAHSIPRLVKVGLAFSLTALWFGNVFMSPSAQMWLLQQSETTWFTMGLALGREAILGALLGFAFGLFLVPARIAGEYLTQELGLSFGNLINPASGVPTGSITQIFDLIGVLIFLGLDVHHVFLAVFESTFTKYPIGGALTTTPVQHLVAGAALAEEWGILLVAPTALCLFLATAVLALMARAAPQLNIYAVGFPLRLLVGLIATCLLLPNLVAALVAIFGRCGDILAHLV